MISSLSPSMNQGSTNGINFSTKREKRKNQKEKKRKKTEKKQKNCVSQIGNSESRQKLSARYRVYTNPMERRAVIIRDSGEQAKAGWLVDSQGWRACRYPRVWLNIEGTFLSDREKEKKKETKLEIDRWRETERKKEETEANDTRRVVGRQHGERGK